MDNKVFQEENHCYQFDFSSAVWATDGLHNTFQNYSGPYLPTTTQKSIVKIEIDENPRKPEDQEVERGVWGGNRNLKGVAFS